MWLRALRLKVQVLHFFFNVFLFHIQIMFFYANTHDDMQRRIGWGRVKYRAAVAADAAIHAKMKIAEEQTNKADVY